MSPEDELALKRALGPMEEEDDDETSTAAVVAADNEEDAVDPTTKKARSKNKRAAREFRLRQKLYVRSLEAKAAEGEWLREELLSAIDSYERASEIARTTAEIVLHELQSVVEAAKRV